MIETRKQLREFLEQDYKHYYRKGLTKRLFDTLLARENTYIWRYIKTMRYCDYYTTINISPHGVLSCIGGICENIIVIALS